MSTHPYIPLYVDDYDAHTSHLTAAEDGVYCRLLRLCWRTPGCSLPNDLAWIARKIRLSAEDFETIAKPVMDEFFRLQRGRLVQKRLKDEYDNISRKKTARKVAGKKGGEAKALKNNEKTLSNATDLPRDTCAFPEPEPVREESPIAPKGASSDKTVSLRKSDIEAIWAATPKRSRERSSKGDVQRALVAAAKRGHPPADILAGLAGYFASEGATRDDGAFVKGVHRMIEADRWQVFAPASELPLEALAAQPAPEVLWAKRIVEFKRNGYWNRLDWGPDPARDGCAAPASVLDAFGYGRERTAA